MTVEQAGNMRNRSESIAPEVCERVLQMHVDFMRAQRRKEIENLKQAATILLARRAGARESSEARSLPGDGTA